jgi:hypothetical protein
MALDSNLIMRGAQAALEKAQPFSNFMGGAQSGQQLMRGDLQNQQLQQNVDQQAALAPLQQRALEQGIETGDLQNQTLQASLDALGVPDEATAKQVALNVATIAGLPTAEAKLAKIKSLKEIALKNNRTTENLDELEAAYMQDPAAGDELLSAGIGALQQTGFLTSDQAQPKQKAEGGMVFDPDSGTFSVDPVAKKRLNDLAELKLNRNVVLDASDRQSINKDITSMIKDTVGIRNTAQDLERLGNIGGGPSAIAMVFKFMKALDPQSTVREGEFTTAEEAAGVPDRVLNIYNKLVSGERLGEGQVKEFVKTAKQLANSAIDSSTTEVNKFLDTFEESIPGSFVKKTKDRLPGRFDVGSAKKVIKFDTQGNIIP